MEENVVTYPGNSTEAVHCDREEDNLLNEIESLCMRCGENGTTRFLLTQIPHFREIVLMAFECPNCGEKNNEVQFAGKLEPHGCHYELKVPVGSLETLNRQVVKSDSASIKVPELDFEIPPEAQRGTLSTVEGVLLRASDELQALQDERRKVDPATAEAIDGFLEKLNLCVNAKKQFTFVMDDPAGNSFIENPNAPSPDPLLCVKFFNRTQEQQAALGYLVDSSSNDRDSNTVYEGTIYTPAGTRREPHGSVGACAAQRAIAQGNSEEVAAALFKYAAPEEVMTFPSTCGACAARCETRMYVTNIPYFKEVIIMASTCDICGYRNSELKPGGSIPEKGKRITVKIVNKDDLSRDVIKSDSSNVFVPELDLELARGTLGGLVTTVEGLMVAISENLKRVHGFSIGDSADNWQRSKWKDFDTRLKKLLEVEAPWTLVLEDPLANSFIAPVTETIEADQQLKFEEFERSWEQNEEFGLNDMDTSSADTAYNEQVSKRDMTCT